MENSYKEEDLDVDVAISALTDTVAQLTVAMQTQNDILLVLLHNLDLQTPDWKTIDDIEKEVGPKVQKCIDLMRKIHGPSETDKS